MFSVLTKYLHQYKHLYIPYVGSFELVEQPARLDFADKLIYPPVLEIRHFEGGTLKDAQVEYIKEELEVDTLTAEQKLKQFGQGMLSKLNGSSFTWNGLGTLIYNGSKVEFRQDQTNMLTPVDAHKVIRENAQHTVLIGEQEVQSGNVAEYIHASQKKRSYLVIIGWILLALAILFLIYYFYKEGFIPGASGSKNKVITPQLVLPVWIH